MVWSWLVRAKIKLGLLFGRSWRSRRSGFGWSSRNFLATFATRATSALAAAIAAVATLAEQAVALLTTAALVTAMAAAEQLVTAALVTTMATAEQLLATTAIAATAVATAIAATAAIATESAGVGLLFTADQGDTSNREKNRDTTKNNTIHPRSSKKTYRYRKRKRFVARVVVRGGFTACGETKPAGQPCWPCAC